MGMCAEYCSESSIEAVSVQVCGTALCDSGADAIPYYRMSWRIALVTVCPVHHCVIEDLCPRCRSPLMSRRHGVGREKFRYVEALRRCYQCGFNLGDTTPRLPDRPD